MTDADGGKAILRETLEVFERSTPPSTPLTTSEVAESLECTRRAAYNRLERLADRGDLATKKVGARGRVWWLPRPAEGTAEGPGDVEEAGGPGGERPDGESGQALQDKERQFRSLVDAVEEYAIFMLDTEGRVVTWNEGAVRIKGYDRVQILGEHFATFYTDEDRDAGTPERNLERAATEGSVQDEGWRVRADGSRFWANVTITALYGPDGELQGYAKVTRDMTDRREREQRLRQERNLLERVFDAVPVGIGFVSPDGEIVRANDQADEFLRAGETDRDGYQAGSRDVYDEDGEYVPPGERPYAKVFDTGEPIEDWHCQLDLSGHGRRWLSINAVPLTDEDGEVERVVVTGEDITQFKEQARRLERRRDELEAELDEVFDRVDDAFYAVDEQFRFTYVNERAEQLLQHPEEELLGESVWEVFPEATETPAWEAFHAALEEQEPTSYEVYFEPLEVWVEASVYPSHTGLSVYFRDVTERKERERELEEYETIVETMNDGVYVVDAEGTFRMVNDAYVELTGYSREQLLGSHVSLVVDEDVRAAATDAERRLHDDPDEQVSLEAEVETASGERVPAEATFSLLPTEENERPHRIGVVRDVSERKERERALEEAERRYRTLAEHLPDGAVGVYDEDLRYTDVDGAIWDDLAFDAADLEGETVAQALPAETAADLQPVFRAAVEDGEPGNVTTEFLGRTFEVWAMPLRDDDGDIFGGLSLSVDVTDRVEQRRALEESERRYRTLVENFPNGAVALVDEDLQYRTAGGTPVDVEADTGDDLEQRHVREAISPELADVLEPRYRAALNGESSAFEHAHGGGHSRFHVFPVRDDDGEVFAAMGMSQDITEQVERERELERQRERLAALNHLNEVVREINDAVVDQSTREEIERTVCEALADSDSYEFAWVADVDPRTQSIEQRIEAGVDGYLAEVDLSVDPEEPTGQGPVGRAVRTKEMQVSTDVFEDPDFGPWQDVAEEYGFRSFAAIPVTHEGTRYGVLGVYSGRVGAFADEERAVVGQLGETVGHAIAAVERKQALMSDDVVEVEFRLRDVFQTLGAGATTDGTVTIDRTVPAGDGRYLAYGTATEDAMDGLEAFCEELSHWEEVTVLGREFDEVRFELQLSEPPVVSVVASHGGDVKEATIEDGDFHMTIHLPPSVDVRSVTDAIEAAYPSVEMVSRRQVTDVGESRERVERALLEGLTERQRAALEAAYQAGFFEWPRESSGEEVADSLDVNSSTFHQHLRFAQKKLFAAFFDDSGAAA